MHKEANLTLMFFREDFKVFLPYMGVAAILVMWQGPFAQTLVQAS